MGIDPRVAVPQEGKDWLVRFTDNCASHLNFISSCFTRNYARMLKHPAYSHDLSANEALFIDLVKHDARSKVPGVGIINDLKAKYYDIERYINLLFHCLSEYRSFVEGDLPLDPKAFVPDDFRKAHAAAILCKSFDRDAEHNDEVLAALSVLKHKRNVIVHACYSENKRLFATFNLVYELKKFLDKYTMEVLYMINIEKHNNCLVSCIAPKTISQSRKFI